MSEHNREALVRELDGLGIRERAERREQQVRNDVAELLRATAMSEDEAAALVEHLGLTVLSALGHAEYLRVIRRQLNTLRGTFLDQSIKRDARRVFRLIEDTTRVDFRCHLWRRRYPNGARVLTGAGDDRPA